MEMRDTFYKRLVSAALLASVSLPALAETSNETVYMCERRPGVMLPQLNPCGTTPIVELKPGVLYSSKPADGLNQPVSGTGENAVQQAPDGKLAVPDPQPAPAAATPMSQGDRDAVMKNARMHMLKWAGFALIAGVIGLLLGQSFWLWLILGAVLRMVLVALNVISF